jgi:hypothetical protein
MASVAGRVHHVVHSAVPSSGSDGPAVQCPPVRCPVHPVSSPSGVHPSGVHPSGVRPSGVRPSGVQPAAVRLRRSGRVHLVHPRRRWRPGRGGGNRHHRNGPRSWWAAASWSGSMDGRAGPDAGEAAEVALVSGVGGGPGPGGVTAGGRARPAERPGRPGRRAKRRRLWLRGGHGSRLQREVPQRPRGCRPGWVATTVGGGHGAGRPGWAGPEGPMGVPAGMGVRPQRGPGWQRALPALGRQRCDLG